MTPDLPVWGTKRRRPTRIGLPLVPQYLTRDEVPAELTGRGV